VTCFAYCSYLKQNRADRVVGLEKPRRSRRQKIRRTASSEVGRSLARRAPERFRRVTLFVVEPTSIARLET